MGSWNWSFSLDPQKLKIISFQQQSSTPRFEFGNMEAYFDSKLHYQQQMSRTSRENRRDRPSRGKGDIELPKITKQPLLQNLYLDRYQWITRNTEYLLLSTPAVEQEQQYLNNELRALNEEYTELLRNINTFSIPKPLKKSRQVNANDRSSEIRDIEIDNNNTVIAKLRGESELLYRRLSAVSNGRSESDCAVVDLREKILKTKQKIKELKLRSKEMGDNIESGQDAFTDLKRLEEEYKVAESKRGRLEEKWAISNANSRSMQQKLDEIAPEYAMAEGWLSENSSLERVSEEERTLDQHFKQRSYQLEIAKKMVDSTRNTKQQKYLQLLRGLEDNVEKIKIFDQKLQKLEIKNLYQKKQIMELEELFAQSMSFKKERSMTGEKSNQNSTQLDQILQLQNSHKDFSNYQINLVKGGSSQKLDSKKYYTNRLRPSNTKPLLSETNKLISDKEKLMNEIRAVNKTEFHDVKPIDLEKEVGDMMSMMKQVAPSRAFRTSRSKLRQEPKQNIQKVEEQVQILPQQHEEKIIQESIQQSPVKQEALTQQEHKQTVEPPILPQPQSQPQIPPVDSQQARQLERKKDLINNYVQQFQEQEIEEQS